MAAVIKSSIPAKPIVIGSSREDLDFADVVTIEANDLTHLTYSWSLMFTPTDVSGAPSAAVLSALVGPGPITFTVDNEGPYLIRLIADSGLPTEDIQYVRLRRLTTYGSLRLVAAGERRDGTNIVPVDATLDGWTLDQNYNIQKLESAESRIDGILGTPDSNGFYLSLDSAYDGWTSVDPAVQGSGDGAVIIADSAPVTVVSTWPVTSPPLAGLGTGKIVAEGGVEIGAYPDSEIKIEPNPNGTGPVIYGGHEVDPDTILPTLRAIPALTVRAGYNSVGNRYSLNLETKSCDSFGTIDTSGSVNLRVGDSEVFGGSPGSLNLQSGTSHWVGGSGGNINLCTGYNSTSLNAGIVHIINPVLSTGCSLTAAAVFAGGTDGDISFDVSGYGRVTALIAAADNLAAVQTKLNDLPMISCVVNPANDPITITHVTVGETSDIYLTGDNVGGVLNTALGDFSISGGATFTFGTYATGAILQCVANRRLDVISNIVVDPAYSLFTKTKVFNIGGAPYPVDPLDYMLAVDTSGGPTAITLPNIVGAEGYEGRTLIIKDAKGNAAANNITINCTGGTIDGWDPYTINTNWTSLTIVSNGADTWMII